MFAIESLALAGETYQNSESVRKACDFLLSKQMDCGGWGESYLVSSIIESLYSCGSLAVCLRFSLARQSNMYTTLNHK